MINKRRKDAFLDETYRDERINANCRSFLFHFCEFEDVYGVDVCMFTKEQIDESLRQIQYNDANRYYGLINVIKKYIEWCAERRYIKKSDMVQYEYTMEDFRKYINLDGYFTYDDIVFMTDQLSNPCDRILLAAPFYGFNKRNSYEDLMSVRSENIGKERGVITLKDREIPVPGWLLDDFVLSINEYTYTDEFGKRYNLIGDGVIKFRESKNTTAMGINGLVTNKYCRLFAHKFNADELTYTKVFKSGVLYFSKKIMIEEKITDPADLLRNDRFKREVAERYSIKRTNFYVAYVPILSNEHFIVHQV